MIHKKIKPNCLALRSKDSMNCGSMFAYVLSVNIACSIVIVPHVFDR